MSEKPSLVVSSHGVFKVVCYSSITMLSDSGQKEEKKKRERETSSLSMEKSCYELSSLYQLYKNNEKANTRKPDTCTRRTSENGACQGRGRLPRDGEECC